MPPSGLLKYVPAEAVYHRPPVADERNALFPWREAIKRVVKHDECGVPDDVYARLTQWPRDTETPWEFPTGSIEEDPEPVRGLEETLTWRRQKLLFLLDGHPEPFDPADTARRMGQRVAQSIRDWEVLRGPRWFNPRASLCRLRRWLARRLRFQPRWEKTWPPQLGPGFPLDWLLEQEQASDRAEDRESMRRRFTYLLRRPTDAQLSAARQRLHRIPNPLGIEFAYTLSPELHPFLALRDVRAHQRTESLLAKQLRQA